jgi:hypothetical protein
MTCPEPARLQAYSLGALPDDQMEELRIHVASCEACRRLSAEFSAVETEPAETSGVADLWRRIQPAFVEARAREPKPSPWRWLAWVAVPAAAALVLLWVRPSLPPETALTLPAPARASAPPLDLQLLARVDPAAVELPIEDLLVTRATGASGLPPAWAAAFQAYQQHDYSDAARRFLALSRSQPPRFELFFYQGVSLLLNAHARESVAPLQQAKQLGGVSRASQAQWYLALAYLHSNDAGAARRELEPLCRGAAAHSAAACGILRGLAAPGK